LGNRCDGKDPDCVIEKEITEDGSLRKKNLESDMRYQEAERGPSKYSVHLVN
jgi:hypothetical protein